MMKVRAMLVVGATTAAMFMGGGWIPGLGAAHPMGGWIPGL